MICLVSQTSRHRISCPNSSTFATLSLTLSSIPPLLLLGLSQNFGISFTPTLGFYYLYPGTLVHWYIGHCVPWVHCFWYIGTSLPWYIVMYHVPMYSSTFATWTQSKFWYIFHPNFGILLCVPWYIGTLVHWTLCTLGTLLLVHWYIFTLVHCHVPCTHVLLHFCYLDLVKILVHLSPQL